MQRDWIPAVSAVLPPVLRLLAATWSFRILPHPSRELVFSRRPFIGVVWHQTLIPMLMCFRGRGFVVMISQSRDGELIARASARLGCRSVRGSSSRGGREALAALIDEANRGSQVSIVADGPRGPARDPKIGCVVAARRTGLPIIPAGIHVGRALSARSWDRTQLPLPFSRIVVAFGDEIRVPADAGEEECERLRLRVRDAINDAESRARAACL